MLPPAKYLTVNGIRTRYFEAGTGQPLVLCHGGDFNPRTTPSATDWCINFGRLAERYRVVAFDKLGCGYTDLPEDDADFSMRATLRHGYDFIREMRLENVLIWGHSRGGLLALRTAIDHPEVIAKVVVMNSNSSCAEDPVVPRDFYNRVYPDPDMMGTSDLLRKSVAAISYDVGRPSVRQYIDVKVGEFEERFGNPAAPPPSLDRVLALGRTVFLPDVFDVKYETLDLLRRGRLQRPILAVWGFNDPTCPAKVGNDFFQHVAQRARDAEYYVVNQAGHQPHVDRPEQVEDTVVAFLER